MFEGCIIKYKKSPDTGEVNQISVTYPADENGGKLHLSVPLDENNRHYQDIQEWVADGNTIQEAD
tara:strand:+ start:222 stop:416 length:195 start_codon:yes stop_codon:yes gene_type:complete